MKVYCVFLLGELLGIFQFKTSAELFISKEKLKYNSNSFVISEEEVQ